VRVGGWIFAATAVFFAVIAAVYWYGSYEDAGTFMLLSCAGLGLIFGGYLLWKTRRGPEAPEDRGDVSPRDVAGVVGAFPSSSVWPLALAGGAVLAVVGLVFGVWFAIPGAVLIVIAAGGAVVETRRAAGPPP
jgi:uncharacterized iron-regulated membrane protein